MTKLQGRINPDDKIEMSHIHWELSDKGREMQRRLGKMRVLYKAGFVSDRKDPIMNSEWGMT